MYNVIGIEMKSLLAKSGLGFLVYRTAFMTSQSRLYLARISPSQKSYYGRNSLFGEIQDWEEFHGSNARLGGIPFSGVSNE